jgi:hypothetical protein
METSEEQVEASLLKKRGCGRPRKYATEEEAKEAKLRKDRENYERKNPDVEHGKVGRKAIRTIEEIREKGRERYHNKKKQKGVE